MNSVVGKLVLLSDGREGIIKFVNPVDPTTPIIETTNEFVDLYTQPSIHIKMIFS
jgi:hypothetical protein